MPAIPLPLVNHLVGLPHGWARGLGVLGNNGASYTDDRCSSISFSTSELVDPAGNIFLYIISSEDGLHWTDGVDPQSSSSQDRLIGSSTRANQVQQLGGPMSGITILPNTRYSFNSFSIRSIFGYAPAYWTPLVWNMLGGPLSHTITPTGFHTLEP